MKGAPHVPGPSESSGPAGDRSLAILSYHKIGEPSPGGWETWYYVPEELFVSHLSYLTEHGWQTIDDSALIRGLTAPESLPERAALITFDDAYRSVVERALPRMLEFRCPGVIFVPTAYVGGVNEFDANSHEPEEPICDWDELRELAHGRVSVHSHSVSHRPFSDLEPAEVEMELLASKAVIEENLGRAVELFAFPYGDGGHDPRASRQTLERCGYRAACLYGGTPLRFPVSDRYRLMRLAIGRDSDLATELDLR